MGELIRDRYEPLRVAGRGGQGEVLQARDRVHDRLVALKVRDARGDRDALLAEARILLGLRPHPGVTLVRDDLFLPDGRCVLVMDWIEGKDLGTVLDSEGAFDYERACAILEQIADALDHLHSHHPPIVHKDVKPSNVILTSDGRVVLVDFGIAQERGATYPAGTRVYQAPEVARGAEVGPPADVFGLAATAFELLTGEHPGTGGASLRSVPPGHRSRVEGVLARGMSVDPARRPVTAGELVSEIAPPPVPSNLPSPPSSFVGRSTELATVADLMGTTRLLTLTGVGGAGKTRLGIEAACAVEREHPDGVWFVDLTGLGAEAAEDAVPLEIADVLDIREEDSGSEDPIAQQVISYLEDKELLVVLDNCEQVLDAAGRITDRILRFAPGVRVLATSREALGVDGEVIWQVPPLGLPGQGSPEGSDAVRLFLERARAVLPTFTVSPEVVSTVAEICRRLDGIPLAIELAASRVKVLGVDRLAERLDDRFRVLTGGSRTAPTRQQTLEAAIDWSYELLRDTERTLLERLSVFSGGFTLDAAEAVCAGDGVEEADVLDLLSSLVDKSLVDPQQATGGTERFRLLETLRQYAQARLVRSGRDEEVRRRHRDHFAAFAARMEERTAARGAERREALAHIDAERDNLRAALDRSEQPPDDPTTSTLASALASHLYARGHATMAIEYLRMALDHLGEADTPEREADLRTRLADSLHTTGDGDAALAEAERARDLVVGREPSTSKIRALLTCASMIGEVIHRDPDEGLPLLREALDGARAIGDRASEASAQLRLSRSWDEAITNGRRALSVYRELDDREATISAFNLLFNLFVQARRMEGCAELADDIASWLDAGGDHDPGSHLLFGDLAYFFLLSGRWDETDEVLGRMTEYHLEAYMLGWVHHVRGSLRWTQGRLDDAGAEVAEWRKTVFPRWYHDFYSLAADVAADAGRLEDARAAASEYGSVELDKTERSMLLGVLAPVVRAEVNAALEASGADRTERVRQARETLRDMRDILDRHPPVPGHARQYELPETYLMIAEAELSRVTGPSPDAWRSPRERAFMAYWKLYTRFRFAEALLATGEREEGAAELRAAHKRAAEMGSGLVRERAEELAAREGIGWLR